MAAYVSANYGLPIFDATEDIITINSKGQHFYHIINVITTTTVDIFTNYGSSPPRATPQLAMPIRVATLIYFMTSQEVRTPQAPTTTSKFALTPGQVNRKLSNTKPSQSRRSIKYQQGHFTQTERASSHASARDFFHL